MHILPEWTVPDILRINAKDFRFRRQVDLQCSPSLRKRIWGRIPTPLKGPPDNRICKKDLSTISSKLSKVKVERFMFPKEHVV